jgi:DNA-binding winged helix-turn-helix (wHTH) protein
MAFLAGNPWVEPAKRRQARRTRPGLANDSETTELEPMSTQLNPVARRERSAGAPEAPNFPARYARFGNFQVDLQREELYQDDQRIKVQAQVYRALLLLLSRAGEIISREEVRKWLWPEIFLANLDANVNTTMNKLRQILGDSPDNPRYIETLPRRGYSFIATVEYFEQPDPRAAKGMLGAAGEVVRPAFVLAPVWRSLSGALRMAGFLVAGILLGALLMLVWFFAQAKDPRAIQTSKPVASSPMHKAG